MWLLILEAGVAMFLLAFIVWWTLPSSGRTKPPSQPTLPQEDSDRQ